MKQQSRGRVVSPLVQRSLDLVEAPGPGRPAHLSAASGLVRAGKYLYVVADDEHHLGMFGAAGEGAGCLVRLFDGELPASRSGRKKKKPDLEALALLPPSGAHAHGALLALGSGSKRRRRRGALLGLDAAGAPRGEPRVADLSAMYRAMEEELPELNIEGAVVRGGELCLLQRGGRNSANALLRLRLADVLSAFASAARRAPPPFVVQRVELGGIEGVPLGFTDGAALPGGGMVFSAVAEDTDDSFLDGACMGSALGIIGRDGKLRSLQRLEGRLKVEGVCAGDGRKSLRLLLVTDADDPRIAASLLSARLDLA